ncbi:hypothetical protein [Limnoraphis robusta]|uniref:Integral membrane protein n=1 Tax=Limnoraphis robusta CCNP1315 TaxID=3110306 RepID=A0ABU5U3C6_9CYAN|nr:hypothetical protein [Limnoraphis robusta]MEA5521696.1 hypothetical protein [Limnoraphis robusta CCNP1315]MEA5547078.1 hypothetical protein [Limnoraphis robusta CCNP1324]
MTVTEQRVQKDQVLRSHLWKIIAFDLLFIGAMMIRAILNQKTPMRYFGETGIISWFSCLQLLILAGLAWKIYRIRKLSQVETKGKHAPQTLWKLIAMGFFFLAVDEIVQIHEATDFLIHWIFQIPDNSKFLQLDGLIVAGYSAIGAYILYSFWDEFQQYRSAFYLFIIGFALKATMVLIDVSTDDQTVFSSWFTDPKSHKLMYDWVQTVEESFKILAEGAFIAAFLVCVQIAKRMTRAEITN